MTDIPAVLAGWEEARTNLGRKGSLRTIELRTAGQKVADALRELTTVSGGRISTALELAHDIRYREPLWYSRGHVADVLEGLVVSLAACLERETQLREALREHSAKPEAFMDIVEQVCPGPFLEMFSRRARLGWDTHGNESLGGVAA